jgi:hypothetical protein
MGTIKTFALALALSVVCLGLIGEFGIETRTPARAMRWNQIGEWSGSGKGSTPIFTVAASRWRIRWAAQPSPNTPGGRMNVYVFRDGESALLEAPVRRWVDFTMFDVGNEVLVLSGRGTYWLRCDCPQVEWTLDVDQIVD